MQATAQKSDQKKGKAITLPDLLLKSLPDFQRTENVLSPLSVMTNGTIALHSICLRDVGQIILAVKTDHHINQ